MMWLDTKEEVDLNWFMEALENNEIQLVSRKLTKEDGEEISRQLAECKALRKEAKAAEAV
jgi:hypothetical protein